METSRLGNNKNLGVLVDTNILLYIYHGFDPFDKIIQFLDYRPIFYIPNIVIKELNKFLNSKSIIMNKKANLALQYLNTYRNYWRNIEGYENMRVDDALIQICKDYDLFLFTNDTRLRHKAKLKGVRVIYLRQKSKNIKVDIII
ncbi:hypothetical protein EWF20_03100 [Sulfolobus sp. S-194]|uniref:type II toxin-antitoxin system VapC family toxin n=1 Tax=Sulfolobus sp. S-194 TaxID=2512240 RepID=UPI001436ED73|nr:PIN domain-containing protein [Sulfolobus sp. S-194]QIW23230.1 hypothetical protein EWF20_03100 [Sulfolobus sp. S-194]